jgi:chromosome segregation ATPase
MAIPSVVQGTIETESGKVLEFDSFKASVWLESVSSFRYEPVVGASKPYTVRKESRKAGDYWYGYRKVAGKLHKKYIGRTPELSTAKLEEIATALDIPPQARVTHQVNNSVAHESAGSRTDDRLTALELQMQAVQESLEALRSALSGKSESLSDSEVESLGQELEKWKNTAFEQSQSLDDLTEQNKKLRKNFLQAEHDTERAVQRFVKAEAEVQRLHIELGNLKAENESLKQELAKQKDDYAAQLEISRQFHRELEELKAENAALRTTQPAPAIELPEPADLLNQLKAKRKKSKCDLADVEAILDMLGSLSP